jgi:hypothetical protein
MAKKVLFLGTTFDLDDITNTFDIQSSLSTTRYLLRGDGTSSLYGLRQGDDPKNLLVTGSFIMDRDTERIVALIIRSGNGSNSQILQYSKEYFDQDIPVINMIKEVLIALVRDKYFILMAVEENFFDGMMSYIPAIEINSLEQVQEIGYALLQDNVEEAGLSISYK